MRKLVLLLPLALLSCTGSPHAYAGQVKSRSELVGGPRAIGDVGDWRLSNDKVRFIVQNLGPSRVYTTFGGSLIDADLNRPAQLDPQGRPQGHDGLGELFPAYFLSAIEPTKIEVITDGSDGGIARVRVTGTQSEFLTATKFVDSATIGGNVEYYMDYALGPDDDFLTMSLSIVNLSAGPHNFPTSTLPVPMGFICLFGDGQPVFLPGEAGYDVRFALEKTYARTYALPAFPGLTTDAVNVEGNGVSYALSYCNQCASPFDRSIKTIQGFVLHHAGQYLPYTPIDQQTMLIPFISGTLFGLFMGEAPAQLPGGTAFSTTARLRVSDGSQARLLDEILQETTASAVQISGVVREERSEEPLGGASVVLFQDKNGAPGLAETTVKADANGRFTALVHPGKYQAIARLIPRPNSPYMAVDASNGPVYFEPHVGRAAILSVEVSDDSGRRVPAKITVGGTFDTKYIGQDPKNFLYDYRVGDPYRPTSLTPGSNEYIETTFRAGGDGRAEAQVRPGHYTITVSRGPLYTIDQQIVDLTAGELTRLGAKVTRILPNDTRISADLHVHAQGSVDSDVLLNDRAQSYAAEGIQFMAMTEHNYVEDLQPVIDNLGLTDFVHATPGLELSSLEAGHWNAYPLNYDAANVTHGSIPWFRRTPQALFDDLRTHAKYGADNVIVQANHPRDSIQGYFTSYGLSGDNLTGALVLDAPGETGTFAPSGPGFGAGTFSLDIDAVEVLTGKRFDLLHTYKVPNPPPPLPHPPACTGAASDPKDCMGPPGSVVRDASGNVAYPGALEDWEHFLDVGQRITAVGNSDSHKTLDGEGGYPRNLIDLGHPISSASEISEVEVVQAIKNGHVAVTTAPIVRLSVLTSVGEVPEGSLVTPAGDGTVLLHVTVDAAPWVDVTDVELMVPSGPTCFRGDPCSRINVPLDPVVAGSVRRVDQYVRLPMPAGVDSWVAVEVSGAKSLWPVVIPYEIPTLLLSDAVGTLGAAVGLTNEFGNLKPTLVTQTFPWAVSNPIFVDGNGDGQWGKQKLKGPSVQPPLDGSGDSSQLVDLRKLVGK